MVVPGVGDDVGVVEVGAAAHRDVQFLVAHPDRRSGLGLVAGHAFGAGGGGGVPEVDVHLT